MLGAARRIICCSAAFVRISCSKPNEGYNVRSKRKNRLQPPASTTRLSTTVMFCSVMPSVQELNCAINLYFEKQRPLGEAASSIRVPFTNTRRVSLNRTTVMVGKFTHKAVSHSTTTVQKQLCRLSCTYLSTCSSLWGRSATTRVCAQLSIASSPGQVPRAGRPPVTVVGSAVAHHPANPTRRSYRYCAPSSFCSRASASALR